MYLSSVRRVNKILPGEAILTLAVGVCMGGAEPVIFLVTATQLGLFTYNYFAADQIQYPSRSVLEVGNFFFNSPLIHLFVGSHQQIIIESH